jgi:hypothetical protein
MMRLIVLPHYLIEALYKLKGKLFLTQKLVRHTHALEALGRTDFRATQELGE